MGSKGAWATLGVIYLTFIGLDGSLAYGTGSRDLHCSCVLFDDYFSNTRFAISN
jgi:hypothetical protein